MNNLGRKGPQEVGRDCGICPDQAAAHSGLSFKVLRVALKTFMDGDCSAFLGNPLCFLMQKVSPSGQSEHLLLSCFTWCCLSSCCHTALHRARLALLDGLLAGGGWLLGIFWEKSQMSPVPRWSPTGWHHCQLFFCHKGKLGIKSPFSLLSA